MSLILSKMYEISCDTSIPRKETSHAAYQMAAIESRERYYKQKRGVNSVYGKELIV